MPTCTKNSNSVTELSIGNDRCASSFAPDIAAKALSRGVRDSFAAFAVIQRCQVHSAISSSGSTRRSTPGVKKGAEDRTGHSDRRAGQAGLRNLPVKEGLDEMLTVSVWACLTNCGARSAAPMQP